LYWRRRLQDPRTTSLAWFHVQVTSIVLTPSASRPTNDFIGLVSYSETSVMLTSIASRPTNDFVGLFHLPVTSVVLTPSASRPTEHFVGLVSSSGDVDYVDAISFKTHK
ncbi:hypothetical protein Taro_026587, partial [Colocasia esculenta]|nr:hypothetical protein [Colocasia esculenta]